jgi:tetratricopeptide (TPR) repeat protein
MDTVLRSRLVNEARFLRGLLYFNLVRMFGSVPLLVKEDPPVDPKPASVDDIYNQITEDLSAAEALPASYPVGNGRGRATSGAAKAILAKVYLTRKNYQQAAALAKEVIDSKQYSLWADFADVFKLSSRNGKEAIFSVGFGDGGGKISFWEVGQFLVRLLPKELSAEGVQNAQGWQIPTQALYDSYNPDDQRRAATFITDVHNSDGSITHIRPYIRKYWDSAAEPQGNGTANDFPVIRYADVLLMYAEAMNELGNTAVALDYLNQVHRRAYGYPVDQPSPVDYTGLSQDALRKAIWQERRWEFVAEGQEWFMLARSGTLETAVPLAKPGVTPQQKNYLFPLPQRELDLNANLKQNTGY